MRRRDFFKRIGGGFLAACVLRPARVVQAKAWGFRLWAANDPRFKFGFTGFKGAKDPPSVSGQILFGGNFVCRPMQGGAYDRHATFDVGPETVQIRARRQP